MPQRYTEAEQVLILKLLNYFQMEKEAGKPLLPVCAVFNRVSDALGVSISTIQRISTSGVKKDEDYKTNKSLAHSSSHGPTLHEIHKHVIRTRIYAMYTAGEHVTLNSLCDNLLLLDGVHISISSLSRSLKKLQFKWRKCTISNRLFLMEQPYVAQKRLKFLREYKQNENSPFALKPVVLDETWIYSKGSFRKSWQDSTLKTVRKKSGEGVRYIILHAGSEDGFVPNASLIFKSGSKSGDYHDSMNCVNFERWFEQQLIPNLEEPSLIIMDNASYHSGLVEKIPNQSWPKMLLVEWGKARDISFTPTMMKDEIWDMVKNQLPPKRFRLDELALKYGHRVLRLPPYHCEYNPIEMVWSECKRYYDSKISSIYPVTHDSVLSLWKEALEKVTPEKWQSYFKHTTGIIYKAWEQERLIDASDILPVTINLDESDDNDSDDDDFDHLSEDPSTSVAN